jgi:hypothetical protein
MDADGMRRLAGLFFLLVACAPTPAPVPDAGPATVDIAPSPVIRPRPVPTPMLQPPAVPDPRTPAQLTDAACRSATGAWRCRGPKPKLMAAGDTPILPPSWTVPAWFIDPANSTTCAADTNNCTTGTCGAAGSGVGPCVTWNEINVHRWGCFGSPRGCPRLRQATTVTLQSAQSTTADSIYAFPAIETGAGMLNLQCSLGATQQIASGVLGAVTAKNRNTNQLLQAVLPAPTGAYAGGELIVNSTHTARAWLNTLVSGTTWTISQPLVPEAPPFQTPLVSAPAEVDTWTSGDTVTVYQPSTESIVDVSPIVGEYGAALNAHAFVSQCSVAYPGAASVGLGLILGTSTMLVESSSSRQVVFGSFAPDAATAMMNAYAVANGVAGGPPAGNTAFFIIGGVVGGTLNNGGNMGLDGDVILQGSAQYTIFGFGGAKAVLGDVYVAGGITAGGATLLSTRYTGPIVWGPGLLEPGNGRITYPAGAGAAAAAFKVTTLRADSVTTVCLGIPSAATAYDTCNLPLTATQLDTSLGTTTGCLGIPNGSAFCNYGQ